MKYVALPLVSLSALALAGVALADPPAPRPAAPTQVTFVNLVTGSPTVGVAIRRTRTDPGTVVIPALTAGGRGTFSGEPGFVQVALRPQGGGADAGPMGQPFPWLIPSVPRVHAFSGAIAARSTSPWWTSRTPPRRPRGRASCASSTS